MKVERLDEEILIRIPANIGLDELQDIVDFIRYKELVANLKISQAEVDKLSDEVNTSIWDKIKKERGLI